MEFLSPSHQLAVLLGAGALLFVSMLDALQQSSRIARLERRLVDLLHKRGPMNAHALVEAAERSRYGRHTLRRKTICAVLNRLRALGWLNCSESGVEEAMAGYL